MLSGSQVQSSALVTICVEFEEVYSGLLCGSPLDSLVDNPPCEKTCQHASSWIGCITLALSGNVCDTLRLLKMNLPKQNVNSYVCPKPWPHPISALIRPSQRSDIAFLRTWKTLKNHTTKHVGVNELSNFQSVESAKGSQSALHCCLANFLKLMFFHRPPEIYPSHASNDISLKNLLGRVWALPKQSPALWNGLTCL